MLPGIEFETAINTIEVISEKTEDKQMYDQREKAQRDYEWAISGAREEGREEGIEVGEKLGLEKGERLGFEKGERLGLEKGALAGKIQLLQELLGELPLRDDQLQAFSTDELSVQLADFQQRLRDRRS